VVSPRVDGSAFCRILVGLSQWLLQPNHVTAAMPCQARGERAGLCWDSVRTTVWHVTSRPDYGSSEQAQLVV
jgi:hypothetical protein